MWNEKENQKLFLKLSVYLEEWHTHPHSSQTLALEGISHRVQVCLEHGRLTTASEFPPGDVS